MTVGVLNAELAKFLGLSVHLLEDEDLVLRVSGGLARTHDEGPHDDLPPEKQISQFFDVRMGRGRCS